MIVPMPNKGEGAELLWELALWDFGWEGLDFGSRLVCTLYPGGCWVIPHRLWKGLVMSL